MIPPTIRACKKGFDSAQHLRQALHTRAFRHNTPQDVIINWGSTQPITATGARILNNPLHVTDAINKIRTFQLLQAHGIHTPPFQLIQTPIILQPPILLRTNRQEEGRGIILCNTLQEAQQALHDEIFLTTHIPNTNEYRIHVYEGQVIAAEERTPNHTTIPPKYQLIRNIGTHWTLTPCTPPEDLTKPCVDAIQALQLDFGAVDVINTQPPTILEVNTAPALENEETLHAYTNAIRNTKKEVN